MSFNEECIGNARDMKQCLDRGNQSDISVNLFNPLKNPTVLRKANTKLNFSSSNPRLNEA